MLSCEGNTDDGNEEYGSKNEMDQCCIESAENKPDDIKEQGKTTFPPLLGHNFFSEWPEYQSCNFEALQSPGNTYDGNAQNKSSEYIAQGSKESSEDEPDDISDYIHAMKIRKFIPRC